MKKLLAAAWSVVSTVAMAVPIQYMYTGHVTEVRNYTGTSDIEAHVSLGDTFKGSFYYDPDAPFGRVIEPRRDLFVGPADPNTVKINDIIVTGSSREVQLFDGYPNYPDNVFLAAVDNDTAKLPDGLRGYTTVIRLNFLAPITDMALPRSLSLAAQPNPWFSVTAYSTDGQAPGYFFWGVHGVLDTLSPVPEMKSAYGLLMGLPLLLAMAGRRRPRARASR